MGRRHLTPTILVAASLSIGFPPPPATALVPLPDEAGAAIVERSDVALELIDVPADYEVLVYWAISRYDDAGLTLPPMQIAHHGDDQRPCHGSTGWHHFREGVSFIDICTRTGGKVAERLVVHEMAHAWAVNGLTEDCRLAFQELRGWTYWLGHDDVSWLDLGGEQAAEIMAWGVSDRPIRPLILGQSSCDDLDAGYRALTGRPPRHGLGESC